MYKIVVCLEYQQSTPCICKVRHWDVILPDNQVVHTANLKRQWYSLAKWQIVSTLIATNLGSAQSATRWTPSLWPKSSRRSILMPKVGLGGEEKQQCPHVTYNWCLKVQRASGIRLVLPLICVVLVTQERMPNMTPNAMINVVMPLNASKRQCHLMIRMTVIATIIMTCWYARKTTAPFQLNRLQQWTISWYWCSWSWSQPADGQQDHPNQGTYVSPPHVTTLYGTWGGAVSIQQNNGLPLCKKLK